MAYPATNLNEAVGLIVPDSNALHDIINGDADSTVITPKGREVPTVLKAMVDSLLFKDPIPWEEGTLEQDPLQLRTFTDGLIYWAPTAQLTNPIAMGASPIGDNNWKISPIIKSHNSLTNRSESGAHPASAITMPSGLSVSQEILSVSEEILSRLPSVLDFGAKADGSDTSQAFIDALAEHDHVVVPNIGGTYLIDERVILSDDKKVTGIGMPTLKLKGKNWGDTDAQSAGIFVIPFGVKGCVIERMRLDGNADNHIATNLTNVEVIECDGYDNTVQFCEIFNSQADGIDCDGAMDLNQRRRQRNKFLYNVIYNCRGYGIHNSIGSWGNYCVGNEIFDCGHALQRGGIDSYYGNSSLYSWGAHIIIGNTCYNNYRNFNIQGEYLSTFEGNIHYGGVSRSILDKVTSPLRQIQNEEKTQAMLTGSVKNIRKEGVYSIGESVLDTPLSANSVLTVLEVGINNRLKYKIDYVTSFGELFNRSFVMSYDGLTNTYTDWEPEFNGGYEFQLGYNQVWQNVLSQRAGDQIFTNTTGKPISVIISTGTLQTAVPDVHQVRKDSSSDWIVVGQASQNAVMSASYIVPAGWQYRCRAMNITAWSELR